MKVWHGVSIICLALALIGTARFWQNLEANSQSGTATTTAHSLTLANSTVSISYPDTYGLAITPEQVQVHTYIPPCNEGFEYCIYRNDDAYAGTNFESAGVAITKYKDLSTQSSCLTTPPEGYTNLVPITYIDRAYATSKFTPIADAAAGHSSRGAAYRLFVGTTCYAFETRVGQSQFANYPPGTITLFTRDNEASVFAELDSILASVTVSGAPVLFAPKTRPDGETYESGVRGTVMRGPMCPALRNPPDPMCADKPYATTVTISRTGLSAVFARTKSDANGAFSFSLPPGSYTITALGGQVFPRCVPLTILVEATHYATTTITCDTGIR